MKARLFIFDRFARPLEAAGIDYRHFRAILAVKFTLDRRRQHGWVQGSKRVSPLTWSLIVHAGMGLWLAALPLAIPSVLTAMTMGN
jgi:hypothetical protein